MSNTQIKQHSPYKNSKLYKPETISISPSTVAESNEYIHCQLMEKISLVKKYFTKGGQLADLGCSTGTMLEYFASDAATLVGYDFSERYIAYANEHKQNGNISFVCEDICKLQSGSQQFDCVYSFSTVYHLANFDGLCASIFNVLKDGGYAILDLGNSRSLNAYCCQFYEKEDGYAKQNRFTINDQLTILRESGFKIVEQRSFQLLPLWAGKPSWLWPLLHPAWKNIMKQHFLGKMLDEWISSLPLVKQLAFRHLVVCRKK